MHAIVTTTSRGGVGRNDKQRGGFIEGAAAKRFYCHS